MAVTAWHDDDLLPVHSGDRWAIDDGRRVCAAEAYEVRNRLKRWQPQSPLLIAAPHAPRFVTPVMVPEVADIALAAVRRRSRRLALLCALPVTVTLLYSLATLSRSAFGWAVGLAGLPVVFAIDLAGPMRTTAGIDERTRFLYWLRTSRGTRAGALFWSALITAIGVWQYASMERMGGLEAVFHAYGFMYEDVRAGELWRALTGPLLHYSPLHFLANFLLLTMMGTLAWMVPGAFASVATFVAGSVLSMPGQMLLGGHAYDSCGGVSGGIYALFGLVIVHGMLERRALPQGFAVLCLVVALSGIASSELTSKTVATAAHFTGLASGALAALLLHGLRATVRNRAAGR